MITTKNGKAPLILDVECYRDYFLVKFRNAITGQMVSFPFHEGQPFDAQTVKSLMLRRTTISFNGNGYDIVMIFLAIEGFTNASLKGASDRIIQQKLKPWHIEREYGIRIPKIDHVDIMEVAPGQIGLKLYGARLGCPKLQDLPIEPDASIAPEQRDTLDLYCGNDLFVTGELANYLKSQLQLREAMSAEYGVDLRSKSDAQIAEAVIVSELTKIMGVKPERLSVSVGTAYRYKAPDWISFRSPRLREIFEIVKRADFVVGDSGHVNMPPELNELDIWIGAGRYRMGIGGLHSSECRVAHHASEKVSIIDRDVASYYPNIILNNNFTPAHMGQAFLHVYRKIVTERLAAKALTAKLTSRMQLLEKELRDAIAETQVSQEGSAG